MYQLTGMENTTIRTACECFLTRHDPNDTVRMIEYKSLQYDTGVLFRHTKNTSAYLNEIQIRNRNIYHF